VALARLGTRATASSSLPGYPIHKLSHVNDGRYGNGWSWISNEPGRGWVQLEFPEPVVIDRVVWSRDRTPDGPYTDRLATGYVVEVAERPGAWKAVASSGDRLPQSFAGVKFPTSAGASEADARRLRESSERRALLERRLQEITRPALVYAGRFAPSAPTTRLLQRGDPLKPGEVVAPAAVSALGPPLRLPPGAGEPERRRALAGWITDRRNPLTARVLVNRLWQHHFGRGIVDTPSDFGRNGGSPSHPELLDWLASELTDNGWRMKPIQKLIVLSATYRQAGDSRPEALKADADCRLLWRHVPRRLEAEPLRDAVLAVSGNLDASMGGPGFDLFEPNGNYVKVYTPKKEFGPAEWRRLVYQSRPRMHPDDTFGPFDCPDGGQIAPRRTRSTTALQSLALLNSRFMTQQSAMFAARLEREAGSEPASRVRLAFSLAFQRPPTEAEERAALALVQVYGLPTLCRALLNANEFVFVD
jgi:hypothetical protein